ncbi:MAG TPA: hypothetical protein VJV75_13940, partial [Candidatus Polarisedimenticolia bacterium]|nr:hypothetical protein [Candidatus Polarisedimenticolia bacterium]
LVSAPLARRATGASDELPFATTATDAMAPAATNTGAIVINDNAPATPYPSTINVPAGPSNQLISKVRVTLRQISHTFPLDLDILLVGPEGQSVVLMSDAGGGNPGIGATTLIFDDDARDYVPASSPPSGGVYRPTNYFTGPDPFPAPAPTPSSAPGLAVFNSTHPGGAWSLYVLDTAAGDVGTIAGGWSIEFVTMEQQCYSFSQGQDFFIEPTGQFFIYPVPLTFTAPGVASKVTLALRFNHDQAADMDVMVESPTGEKSIVLSDALGEGPSGVTALRLDDDAAAIVPESPVGMGAFGSVNYDDGLTDVFAAPAPPGPYGYSLGALRGSGVAGTWNLYFMDDDPSLATNGFLFTACLGIVAVAPTNNVNNAAVTIPQGAPGTTAGPASPYPSTMVVSGVPGMIAAVTVDLFGVQHTFPDDLDLLLIGPQGQSVVLMSDAGGSVASAGVNLTFDDSAADPLPDGAPGLAPGRWRPSQYEPGTDAFPLPAPAGPYGTLLSNFEGTEPNGRWSLYVFDDALGDTGSIATGWRLNLTTILAPETFCTTTAIAIPAGAPGNTNGPASLYPGTVVVSGVDMPAGRVRVLIPGLSHTYPDDLDLMLVGPQGGRVMLMSDAGGENPVNGISLIFDDRADGPPGDQTQLLSGTYRVSNYDSGDGDPFPPPAPSVPGTSSIASIVAGTDPNGVWSLYVFDDASGDSGVLAFGWCVEISPLFRPVEASSPVTGIFQLRFQTPTSMTWFDILSDSPVSSIEQYNLYRGDETTQPALLNPGVDSCLRLTTPGFPITGLTDVPPVGSIYWYLLAGANFAGQPGSAGFARTGLGFEARVLDPMGSCP